MNRNVRALSLVEILVAVGVLAVVLIPVLSLATSSRRTAEFNARRYQALQLGLRTLEAARQRAAFIDDDFPSHETPRRIVGDPDEISPFFGSFVGDASLRLSTFAELERILDTCFSVAVTTNPLPDTSDAMRVTATVFFRLSPAHTTTHRLSLETVVARRSPF